MCIACRRRRFMCVLPVLCAPDAVLQAPDFACAHDPLQDAGLLTTPTAEVVRKIDAEKDHAFAESVGRIISQAVKDVRTTLSLSLLFHYPPSPPSSTSLLSIHAALYPY